MNARILRLSSLTTILAAVAGCTGQQGVPGPPGPPGPRGPAGPGAESGAATVDATVADAAPGDANGDVTTIVDSGVDAKILEDSSADSGGEAMDVAPPEDAGEDALDAASEIGSDSAADAEAGPPCIQAACASGSCVCSAVSDAGVPGPTVLATDTVMTGSLAADGTGVYWPDYSQNINRAPLDGGAVAQLLRLTLSFPGSPSGAIAIEGGWLYWLSRDAPVFASYVYRAPALGYSYIQPAIGGYGGTSEQMHPDPTAIAVDTTNVYWICVGASNSSTLTQIPIPSDAGTDGGTDAGHWLLATGYNFTAVAARNGVAYYVDSAVLKSVPVATGIPTVLDTCGTTNTPAVDDAFVYYSGEGGIRRVPVAGGIPTLVAPSSGGLLAIDATNVYWVDGSFVYRAPLTGGCPEPLAYGSWSPAAIAVDATSVYWTDMNKTQVLKIAK
jgi:hypothetical protein